MQVNQNKLLIEQDDYLKQINEPVDNDYTAENKYSSRLWVEKYQTPDITYVENGNVKLNKDVFLNDRILDKAQANDGVLPDDYNKLQLKQEKFKRHLYAFAASMRDEVEVDFKGNIDMRSFYQFCTRVYDSNNASFNYLLQNDYFSSKNIDEIDLGKFCLTAANEVFKVNMLTAKDKDTEELKYSDVYNKSFNDDIKKNDQVNIDNKRKYEGEINYLPYAEKEEEKQKHDFSFVYTANSLDLRDEDKEIGIKTFNYTVFGDKRIKRLEKESNKSDIEINTEFTNLANGIESKEEPEKPIAVDGVIKPEVEDEPIILDEKYKKSLKNQVKDWIKLIVKGEYDLQKGISDDLKNTTASYALGIKAAFEDFPKFKNAPFDLRKDIAKDLKYYLDKNIDGKKQAAESLKTFYNSFNFDRSKLDKNNPKHIEMLNNMKKDGLYVDALSTYFRLTEIHEKRNGVFWLFHPNQNKAEKAAIAEMKGVLKEEFGLTDKELAPYYIDKNGNKKLNSPRIGDEMVEEILLTCDQLSANVLARQKEERQVQTDFYGVLAESPEFAEKEREKSVKFSIDNIYPELYGINNLSKVSTNKEKTVEKGINK